MVVVVASLPVPGQSLRPGATKLGAANCRTAWKRKAAERGERYKDQNIFLAEKKNSKSDIGLT